MENNKIEIDGTKLVAKDIATILNEYPMCEVAVEGNSLVIINHTGAFVLKRIKFD